MTAKVPDLTVSVCEERGHEGHFARITVGYPDHWARFCLTPETAGFLGGVLAAGELKALAAERDRLRALAGEVIDAYAHRDILVTPAERARVDDWRKRLEKP